MFWSNNVKPVFSYLYNIILKLEEQQGHKLRPVMLYNVDFLLLFSSALTTKC